MKPRILFLVPSDYEALERKGVLHMIYDRDEQGFFERVVTIHPLAFKDRVIELSPVHVIYEFGLKNSLRSYMGLLLLPFRIVLFLRNLLRLVKDENIQLIRATDAYLMGLLAWVISRFTGLPFCISIHADYDKSFALDPSQGIRRILRILSKWCPSFVFRKANLIMPIRQSLAEQAIKLCAKQDLIRIIPHGIDLTPFTLPATINIYDHFSIEKRLKIISFVGRLSMENYVDDIFKLARLLGSKRTDFLIVFAGGGREENRLFDMINNEPILQKTVKITGFQKQEVCFDLRKTSAVSLCLMGGFSLIEACAAGRPVVSYDVDWHSELVKNNETGFLIREGDLDGLHKAVDYLIDHKEDSKRMGENAKKLVFERHDIKKTTLIKRKCYQELLKC